MSSLVVFSTSTGNTKKIADAIFSALKDTNKKIVDVNEINKVNVNKFDKIIIGGWIDKGKIDEKAKEFVTNLKNKKLSYRSYRGRPACVACHSRLVGRPCSAP